MNQLRVWYFENGEINRIPVESIDRAKFIIKTKINLDLNNDNITDNAFGLEEFLEGTEYDELNNTWSEWNDEHGRDIMEIIEEESE
jgi:hypothetical protein